ncbi:MAG: hypothetical protein H0V29_10060 [Thermoleophilaceae bacterium]|nr:hypothetical protein [Thermoleophilaceae bacterium]
MRRIAFIAVLVCAALSGCGSTPEDDAEKTVRDWVAAFNDRDPKICSELYSEKFIRDTIRSSGERGQRRCLRQLDKFGSRDSVEIVLRQIDKTVRTGDVISVSTQIETNGNPSRLTFNLTETDGKWRIDAVG